MDQTRAVLFDLDDTLFDHQHSSQQGLAIVHAQYPCFWRVPLADFFNEYQQLLDEYHARMLQGGLSLGEARYERFKELFARHGEMLPFEAIEQAVRFYFQTYLRMRRAVPGSKALLERLKQNVYIAVVTNNRLSEQREKLRACGLDALVDSLIVSDDVGVLKPDPKIYRTALERIACSPQEAVMVGDSWEADVLGACQAGIRAVWFNRNAISVPDPDLAVVIRSFEPTDQITKLLLKNERV
ncbi:MAG: HAD family hydrolase [Omnitrophica WOR_2 bacterium]